MCGIFGYIGNEHSVRNCLDGLKLLEYRGYDSAGIAGIKNGELHIYKEVGNIAVLEKSINVNDLDLSLTIGHTRWATHGKPSKENAHPHHDYKHTVAVVHNGIIENFNEIKKWLKTEKNITCSTDTDTEVIAQMISVYYRGSIKQAVFETMHKLKGSFAIAVIHKNHPNEIIAMARENPLVIGHSDDKEEIFISSDPNAFLGRRLNVFYLKNNEIVSISQNHIEVYNEKNHRIEKLTELLDSQEGIPSKNGFDHFMIKEIFEQPLTIKKAFYGRICDQYKTAIFESLNFTPQELMGTKQILIIACGTAWHAGCIGAMMLEEKARIPTHAELASELRFKNPIINEDTLVIAISQSGETADTLSAVREAKGKGAKVLGIVNVRNSTLTRESDSCIYLNAGPEISVCSTKAFTAQITVLSLFTLYMARLRHQSKEDGNAFIEELIKIPSSIQQILERADEIETISKKYAHFESFFFMGRNYMYTCCLEAALKLKEISYLNANGYPAGEMKHGPIALISKKMPVIAFCANELTFDKMLSNLQEVKARGAPILAITHKVCPELLEIADDVIEVPFTSDLFASLTSSIVGQLIAYYIAKKRGTEIDQPRNLAKSVTVE
ncbi:MAG TPA: glutamine--fructose-6-phosphate transaminase (isomerizing) [Chlamydiales bacterium]|nr:glutamine--fructose-6-phosphate transaminase (isomerizing) [Chlamydiales bacterium]